MHLEQAIDKLDAQDLRNRQKMINSGHAPNRVRFVGIENLAGSDFASFEWGGSPLIMVNVSILP
jgi:hypothetical protein